MGRATSEVNYLPQYIYETLTSSYCVVASAPTPAPVVGPPVASTLAAVPTVAQATTLESSSQVQSFAESGGALVRKFPVESQTQFFEDEAARDSDTVWITDWVDLQPPLELEEYHQARVVQYLSRLERASKNQDTHDGYLRESRGPMPSPPTVVD